MTTDMTSDNRKQTVADDLRVTAKAVRGNARDKLWNLVIGPTSVDDLALAARLDAYANEWEQRQAVIDAAVRWVTSREADEPDPYDVEAIILAAAVDALTTPGTGGEG